MSGDQLWYLLVERAKLAKSTAERELIRSSKGDPGGVSENLDLLLRKHITQYLTSSWGLFWEAEAYDSLLSRNNAKPNRTRDHSGVAVSDTRGKEARGGDHGRTRLSDGTRAEGA